jgi:phospholipase/carboxylesterase
MNLKESEQAIVLEPSQPATAAVIWLHGLGADGNDFVPIVRELGLPKNHGVRFIFPNAPVRPVTINNGMRMRAWYDILSLTRMQRQDEAGIRDSERIVRGYIADENARGVPAGRIILAGFSQGGAIALHTGLRYPERLAGLLALSTYLPLGDQTQREILPARKDTPIKMCHGHYDQMLPMALGEYSRDALRGWGYTVDWHEYPMQHQVCAEEIEEIGAWFRERLELRG